MARPLPPPCRGVLLDNGAYTGCQYGSGQVRVLTGPCDCPVCHGSGWEGMIATWIPHQNFGDPDCGGFLYGIVRDDQGYIECNDCDALVRTLPAADLRQALNEMESGLAFAGEQCPFCGKINSIPGFSRMMAFTCRECGKLVRLSNDPKIDRIFGPKEANDE